MAIKRAVAGLLLCWIALTLSVVAQNGASGTLSKDERSFLTQYLRETEQRFRNELAALSDAQLKFKPEAKSWSVFDIAEHLAKAEDVIYALVTDRIMKAPAQPELKGEKGPRIKDLAIVMYLTNRTENKLQAPEPVQPSGKFASKAEIIASFEKSRARNLAYIETTQDDLRSHFRENGIGMIDAYQWLLVLAAHTERHLEQMREVKAHPHFPLRNVAGLTPKERDFLAGYLQDTRKSLLAEIAGLSEAQLKFKPSAESWSIAENVEHIVLVENNVYANITEKIMKTPARPAWKGEKGPHVNDLTAIIVPTNRTARKFKAPEIFKPVKHYATAAEAQADFEKTRAVTSSYAQTTQEDLRAHFADNPLIGTIDAYQWLLFVAAHGERHRAQIAEVKAHPAFPKTLEKP